MKTVSQQQRLSVALLCPLLGLTRQAYYAHFRHQTQQAYVVHVVLCEVRRIRVDLPRLGTRKLLYKMRSFLLQHRFRLGRDAFFTLLEQHGLLIRARRRTQPRTTFSGHVFHKFPNLLIDRVIDAPHQVWVADITYIPIAGGFAYLFLLTDAYSHKIIGYSLEPTLHARGAVKALRMALRQRPAGQSTIHHSDRGIQYCCTEYLDVLFAAKGQPSMTQNSDPRENAIAERVNGILKSELLASSYPTLKALSQDLPRLISLYNVERPHLSLDLLTPSEAHQQQGPLKRRWKPYAYRGADPGKVPDLVMPL